MISKSATRVPEHTAEAVNQQIQRQTDARVTYYAHHANQIDRRLEELDAEWDIERTLAAGSSMLSLTGAILGLSVNRKWLGLTLVVQGFYLQHTLQGWCPPLPLFRRLGVRTVDEINRERQALKALQGHVADMSGDGAVRAPQPDRRSVIT